MKRVKGVTVTPHYCPIQDKDNAWYKQFQVIVMGLDSIEARRWLNAMACSLVEFEENESGVRKPDLGTVIPLVDGGTEGFSGHVCLVPSLTLTLTLTLAPALALTPTPTLALALTLTLTRTLTLRPRWDGGRAGRH